MLKGNVMNYDKHYRIAGEAYSKLLGKDCYFGIYWDHGRMMLHPLVLNINVVYYEL